LLAAYTGSHALIDIALVFALLASVTGVAFTRLEWSGTDENDDAP